MKIIRWLTFSLAILYILIAFFAITRGQQLPYELRDPAFRKDFYQHMVWMLPLAVMATLPVTVSERLPSGKNTLILVVTLLIAGASVKFLLTAAMPAYGEWADVQITYEKRDNRAVRMAKQVLQGGAPGSKGKREVKLSPFLGIFNIVEPVDIEQADKSGWVKVHRPGTIQYP